MSALVSRLAKGAIWVLLATVAGCASQPSRASRDSDDYRPRPAPPPDASMVVPVPAGATSESLRWAVEAALAERHWTVDGRKPGRIRASVESHGSGDNATIAVAYGPGGIQILPIAASVSAYRYDRWMRLLVSNIRAHVAEIGMGRVVTPSPAPAADPPPAPEPPPDAGAP